PRAARTSADVAIWPRETSRREPASTARTSADDAIWPRETSRREPARAARTSADGAIWPRETSRREPARAARAPADAATWPRQTGRREPASTPRASADVAPSGSGAGLSAMIRATLANVGRPSRARVDVAGLRAMAPARLAPGGLARDGPRETRG